ncbi:hypothetical protein NC651_026747 [Populus alba x Populus x berolinensis]|nr:hypothetical protein NC651_026747 [Populus alba x Populus x berolinensis]
MMTILVLRSFYYSGLSLWVSSFASVSFVLFPCLWFRRSRDSNVGGWLLLGFSCFCSFVPLLPSPYAAQLSFMSPSVSFYSPCSLFLPLCLVFLLGAGTCCLQLQTKMTVWKGCSNTASSPRFFFLYSLLPFFTLPPRFSFCFSVSPPYPLPPSVSSFFPCPPPPPGSSFPPAFIGQRRPCAGNGQLDFNAFNDKTSPIFLLLETVDEEEGNEQLFMKRLCFKWLF